MKCASQAVIWGSDWTIPIVAASALLTLASHGLAAEQDEPSNRELRFGEVTELTVNDDDPQYGEFLVDLDKGRIFSPPQDWQPKDGKEAWQWMEKNGVDLFGESYGMLGIDVIAIPTVPSNWDPHPRIFSQLEHGKAGRPIPITGHRELPATYFFQTREGGKGVLQILAFNERVESQKPASTTIRFKLEKSATPQQ